MGTQMPQWAGSGSSDNEITEIIGLGQHQLASNSASSGRNSTTHSLPLQSHTSYNKHPEIGHDNKKIQLQVIMIILKMRIDNLMSMRTNFRDVSLNNIHPPHNPKSTSKQQSECLKAHLTEV